MNYQPVTAGNETNKNAGPQETNGNTGLKKNVDAGQTEEENVSTQQYIVFPLWSSISSSYKSSDDKAKDYTVDDDACKKTVQEPTSEYDQALKNVLDKMMDQEKEATEQSDAVRKDTPVNTASASRTFSPVGPSSGPLFVPFGGSFPIDVSNLPHDPLMPELEDTIEIQSTGIFGNAYDDHDLETLNTPYADQNVGTEADFNNMEPSTIVSPIPTTRVHSIHLKAQIIGDPKSAIQTRGMTKKNSGEHAMISYIQKQRRTTHKDFHNCLFSCFLSQEEGINYDEVFSPVARVEAIRLFLAFESFMNFPMYQMDVKSAFIYGTIEEEVYVCQPPGFVDPEFPEKVYKLEKALYGLHQAPRAWYETLSTYLLDNGFHRGQINKTLFIKRLKSDILLVQGLQVKQKEDGIFISQDKYIGEILKKFGFLSIRSASTPMETHKALTKDKDGKDVDVHLYRTLLLYWKLFQIVTMQVPAWTGNPQQETKIHVDNESAICVVKNPVYHSKTKHIEIRHHFIRDSYEKRLIEMVKIHTDYNVADLLTKAFDMTRFQFLIASIGLVDTARTNVSTAKAQLVLLCIYVLVVLIKV
ncbi:putative ribonuclease H-like domain-containing protein [Tanacetum coccineum]